MCVCVSVSAILCLLAFLLVCLIACCSNCLSVCFFHWESYKAIVVLRCAFDGPWRRSFGVALPHLPILRRLEGHHPGRQQRFHMWAMHRSCNNFYKNEGRRMRGPHRPKSKPLSIVRLHRTSPSHFGCATHACTQPVAPHSELALDSGTFCVQQPLALCLFQQPRSRVQADACNIAARVHATRSWPHDWRTFRPLCRRLRQQLQRRHSGRRCWHCFGNQWMSSKLSAFFMRAAKCTPGGYLYS